MSHAIRRVAAQSDTSRVGTEARVDASNYRRQQRGAANTSREYTISVVDDEYFVREDIFNILDECGWLVKSYASCEDFVIGHQTTHSACLVLDIHLPGMGGLALLRHMRDMADTTPVIVVSGSSAIDEAVRSMKKGALDFIEKPVRGEQLVASVKRALDLSRQSKEISGIRDAALEHLRGLTLRQREIMARVLAGNPSKIIAADLGISQRTVENHRASIMKRTGARSLPELARLVMSTEWRPIAEFGGL
jgi:two-component system CheB/CheR fusion protein